MAQTQRFLVYIASNHEGLETERYEVARQLARMGILTCGFPCREDVAPYDWNLSRTQIEDADLFLMILGDDYGPMAPTGISHLHRELVHAQSLSKPVLSFVKNTLDRTPINEDQRRLVGFHSMVMKGAYRLWHLREELIAHVKSTVANTLSNRSGGWLKVDTDAQKAAKASQSKGKASKLSTRDLLAKSRQQVELRLSAKVYQAGNNTLEEVMVPLRLDALFTRVAVPMNQPSTDDKIRSALERFMEPEVKRQLLTSHPGAHAVDDIKIDKQQFQQLLEGWQELGYIESEAKDAREIWHLTANGVKRLAAALRSGQAV